MPSLSRSLDDSYPVFAASTSFRSSSSRLSSDHCDNRRCCYYVPGLGLGRGIVEKVVDPAAYPDSHQPVEPGHRSRQSGQDSFLSRQKFPRHTQSLFVRHTPGQSTQLPINGHAILKDPLVQRGRSEPVRSKTSSSTALMW
jgi:hypothetical protein